jgi:hypothetical protein
MHQWAVSPLRAATTQDQRGGERRRHSRRTRRKGRDSNPGDGACPPNGFQDRRIQPLCHPSKALAMLRGPPQAAGSTLASPVSGRGGRAAEGTRLLSEYGHHVPSRVRIPPSPLGFCPQTRALLRIRSAAAVPSVRAAAGTWLVDVAAAHSRSPDPVPIHKHEP